MLSLFRFNGICPSRVTELTIQEKMTSIFILTKDKSQSCPSFNGTVKLNGCSLEYCL